jgi:hypothetical protein
MFIQNLKRNTESLQKPSALRQEIERLDTFGFAESIDLRGEEICNFMFIAGNVEGVVDAMNLSVKFSKV